MKEDIFPYMTPISCLVLVHYMIFITFLVCQGIKCLKGGKGETENAI